MHRNNGFGNRTRSEVAPVEVLGFTTCSSTNFVWENRAVLATGLKDFLTRSLRIFAKLLNSYRPKELCNE